MLFFAKIGKFSEMENVLTVKDSINVELMSLFVRFVLGNLMDLLDNENAVIELSAILNDLQGEYPQSEKNAG